MSDANAIPTQLPGEQPDSREVRLAAGMVAYESLPAPDRNRESIIQDLVLRQPADIRDELLEWIGNQRFVAGYAARMNRAESAPSPAGHTTLAGVGTTPLAPGEYFGKDDKYEILCPLGKGGMGAVYKARQRYTNQQVALKVIRADKLNEYTHPIERAAFIERFRREADTLGRIRDNHVVRVLDADEFAGQLYCVMEFIDGGSLSRLLVRQDSGDRQPLDGKAAARYVEQAARGVHAAHLVGIIHRDIKPGNLLLRGNECVVADWGLAKGSESAPLTTGTSPLGTPAYMAPEQVVTPLRVDARTDVYGLGATLYELLTGRYPFHPATDAALLRKIVDEEPIAPRRLNPRPDRLLETICLKCLSKDPADRYPTAEELAADLARYQLGAAVLARRPSRLKKRARHYRRNWKRAALYDLALLAVMAVPVLAVLFLITRLERDKIATDRDGAVAQRDRLDSELKRKADELQSADQALKTRDEEMAKKSTALDKLDGDIRGKEAEVRRADDARRASQRRAAASVQREGLDEIGRDQVPRGLLLLALAQRLAPADSEDPEAKALVRSIGVDLSAGIQEVHQLYACIDLAGQGWFRLSPDGKTLVTPLDLGGVQLWDVATGNRIGTPLQQGHVDVVLFSPDSKTILTGSQDNTARVWNAVTGESIGQPLEHPQLVTSIALLPGGKTVVTGCWDKAVRVWDIATGRLLFPPLPQPDIVSRVILAPDAKSMLIVHSERTAQVWDVASGKRVGDVLVPPGGQLWAIRAAGYNAKGQAVVVSVDGNRAHLWDVANGKRIGSPWAHHADVSGAYMSPDGAIVLTCSVCRGYLWDTESGLAIGTPLRPDPEPARGGILAATFSPDKRHVLIGATDMTARVWEVASGKAVGQPLRHRGAVCAMAFSPDGSVVVTGSEDGTARLWDRASGAPVGSPLPHPYYATAVAFADGGSTIASISSARTSAKPVASEVRLWRRAPGRGVGSVLRPASGMGIMGMSFQPKTGSTLLTVGSGDAHVRLWHTATGDPAATPLRHRDAVLWAEFSPDGRRVLTRSIGKVASLWDTQSGELIHALEHPTPVTDVRFSPDGQLVLTGADDGIARFWDTSTGKELGVTVRHPRPICVVRFSPDGKRILTGGMDRRAQLWDAATGKPIGPPLQHENDVRSAAFSPDGKDVLTGSYDGTARLWDATTGIPRVRSGQTAEVVVLRHDSNLEDVAFSPLPAQRILTRQRDGGCQLWNRHSGDPIGAPLVHDGMILSAAFSSDGTLVATGGRDNRARLWDAANGRPVGPPITHKDFVSIVAFAPDGKRFLTGCADNVVRFWLVPAPVEGTHDRITAWIEALSGTELTDAGQYRALDGPGWRRSRQRLAELGGPVHVP